MPPWTAYPPWNDARPSKTIAVVALILAIIPLGITTLAAIVLAANVLVEIPKGKARGKGLAMAALVIAWLWTSVIVAVVLFAVLDAPRHAQVRTMSSEETSVFAVRGGDCLLTIPSADVVDTVRIVSCSAPHRGEVFAIFHVAAGPQPQQAQVERRSDRGCATRFAAYAGIEYSRSKLEYLYMPPIASSIDVYDGVICIVTDGTKLTLGSLKNARR